MRPVRDMSKPIESIYVAGSNSLSPVSGNTRANTAKGVATSVGMRYYPPNNKLLSGFIRSGFVRNRGLGFHVDCVVSAMMHLGVPVRTMTTKQQEQHLDDVELIGRRPGGSLLILIIH